MNNKQIKKIRIKRKAKSILKITANSLFFAVVGFFFLFFAVNVIDVNSGYNLPFFGLRTSVIMSSSMQFKNPENTYLTDDMKRINKNDVIITNVYYSYDSIQQYDVITYYSDAKLICHRVVKLYSENNKQLIVTRGDSNDVDDVPIDYSLIKGKVINVIPGAGSFITFMQSPYLAIAVFGSLFFVFLSLFIIQVGDYGKYNKLSKTAIKYDDDKTMIINSSEYNENKNKKDYVLIGVDNHYEIAIKKGLLTLTRYIRTDYENRIDKKVVSGIYDKKDLSETIILSILTYAFDTMAYGYNPLKHVKSFLVEKKIIDKKADQMSLFENEINEVIPEDMKEDLTLLNNEEFKYLNIAYKKCIKYAKKKSYSVENCDRVFSYLLYCLKNNINPTDNLKIKVFNWEA